MNEATYAKVMEIEDYLQETGVFYNDQNGRRTAHSDSYMTLVDFDLLDSAFMNGSFSKDEWHAGVEYWLTNENMQPPLRLVGFTLKRKLEA